MAANHWVSVSGDITIITDLNNQKSLHDRSADICIVGGGAAGITLALELRDSGLKILILEAGGWIYEAESQALYTGENSSFKQFAIETTRLRFLGGSTNHWGGTCPRLSPLDFERPDRDEARWPLKFSELDHYYERAEPVLELEFSEDDIKAENLGPFYHGQNRLQPAFYAISPPTRFGQKYLEELEKADDIEVLLHCNVLELVERQVGGEIEHVSASDYAGRHLKITAKKYILATGGLENPRILLMSRRRNSSGIGNSYDQVGRYYMDHPGVYLGQVLFNQPAEVNSAFLRRPPVDSHIGAFLAPSASVLEESGSDNFRFQFQPSNEESLVMEQVKYISTKMAQFEMPDYAFERLSILLRNSEHVANLAYKNLFDASDKLFDVGYQSTGKICHVSIDIEQSPNEESRVTLSDSIDSLGLPKLRLDWRLNDTDLDTVSVAIKEITRHFGESGSGRFKVTSALESGDIKYSLSCHHSGTTRMSEDPKKGVVDSDCRVHGVSNLYITGSSVFPATGWANPTLTIVALTIRLADKIKFEMGGIAS